MSTSSPSPQPAAWTEWQSARPIAGLPEPSATSSATSEQKALAKPDLPPTLEPLTRSAGLSSGESRSSTERVEAMVDLLHTQVAAFRETPEYLRALDFYAAMPNYSFSNTMGLYAQAHLRGDTIDSVMGLKAWQKHGRFVRKGEQAYWVLAPVKVPLERTREYDPNDPTQDPKKPVVVGFKPAAVFLGSQTDGDEPIPSSEIARRLPESMATEAEVAKFRSLLEAEVEARGFSVEYAPIPGSANGFTAFDGSGRVVVDESLSPAQSVKTLAHELGHIHFDHENRRGEDGIHRGDLEVEAESFAYLTCREIGIESDQYSLGYLATWSQDDPEGLCRSTEMVVTKFHEFIDQPHLAPFFEQHRLDREARDRGAWQSVEASPSAEGPDL